MRSRLWVGFVGLGLLGCGSAPAYEPRLEPHHVPTATQHQTRPTLQAPQSTIDAMQICADRFAPKLPGESFAVLFDVTVGGSGNRVKVKDSMLGGSPLESCLASAFERMEIPDLVASMQQTAPSSRSMVGIVQAAAAPIALFPIALAAAGVTILVGAMIYVATDALKESERCKKVKAECIAKCTEATLPTGTFNGDPFFQCRRRCLEAQNCW
jgi:hypothetical protein